MAYTISPVILKLRKKKEARKIKIATKLKKVEMRLSSW